MAWQCKEWGGIRKAETEVVRIKGRRRDKGGGGWEKQISRVGGSAPFAILDPKHEKLFSILTSICHVFHSSFSTSLKSPKLRTSIQN
jgi:hypothetical protein